MKELSINLTKLFFVWAIAVFLVASCGRSAYANRVQCKITELVLADYQISNGAQSAYRAFFVRNISMRPHIIMGKLERDTFECAGNRLSLSANPFQLLHHYLAVNGEAPINSNGAH